MSVKKSLSFNHNRKKATVKKLPSFNNVSTVEKYSSERTTKKKNRKALSMEIDNERRRSPTVKCMSLSRSIRIEPTGADSLKEVDSKKLKAELIRWAKAVAAYARQISGRFGG